MQKSVKTLDIKSEKGHNLDRQRNYGIDLLRIVSMLMIVTLHVLGQGGLLGVEGNEMKKTVLWFMEITSLCSVNCYALISGYVGYGRKIKASSFIKLWFEVVFYLFVFSIGFKIFVPEYVGTFQLFSSFLPISTNKYWYFTAYFALFLFMPFLNVLLDSLNKTEATILLISLIFVFSVFPVILLGKVWGGDLFYTNLGYSILWLSVLYFIGAYLKKYPIRNNVKKCYCLFGALACAIISFVCKCGFSFLSRYIKYTDKLSDLLTDYTSPTILLCAVFLLLFFSRIKINQRLNKIIALVGPTTFGVYIIHLHPNIWMWLQERLVSYINLNVILMVLVIIGTVLAIFAVCSMIDMIRIRLFRICRINQLALKIEAMIRVCFNKVLKSVIDFSK